jgi:chemotaxis protein CheD
VERVVGVSEYAVSVTPEDTLVTHSLGSCVGLVLHDPAVGVAGMLHSMLPTSKTDPSKAMDRPAMYTDTGAQLLLQEVFDRGATRAHLVARIAGAASRLDTNDIFRIGERNYAVLRRVLWRNGILIAAEDVGGSSSRTVTFEVGTGRMFVKSDGAVREL